MTLQKKKKRGNLLDRYGLFFTIFVLSIVELSAFVKLANVNQFYKASFEGMLNGTAHRPFVTRVLTPWITNGLRALLPNKLAEIINDLVIKNPAISHVINANGVHESLGVSALINVFLQLLSLFGFFYFFIKLARSVLQLSKANEIFLIFFASLGLIPLFNDGYIYDFPQLFLCTLAYYLIATRKVLLYFIVFTSAILNKETSIVLLIPSVLLFWNYSKPNVREVINGLFAQFMIFIIIRLPLFFHFQMNPGVSMAFHFFDHLSVIRDYPFKSTITLIVCIVFGFLLVHQYKNKPTVVSLGICSGFILFILFLIGGYPFEFRVFYEIYGILVISITWSLLKLRGFEIPVNSEDTEKFIKSLKNLIIRD